MVGAPPAPEGRVTPPLSSDSVVPPQSQATLPSGGEEIRRPPAKFSPATSGAGPKRSVATEASAKVGWLNLRSSILVPASPLKVSENFQPGGKFTTWYSCGLLFSSMKNTTVDDGLAWPKK